MGSNPLKTVAANKIEKMNELLNYLCQMILMIFCNPANMAANTKDILGWVINGLVCVCIVANIYINVKNTLKKLQDKYISWKKQKKIRNRLKARFQDR